jgi:uncharacterized protein YutE (UPF0331/DUF86 family)
MIDRDLVRRKLSRLNMYLDKLAPIAARTFKDYVSDFYLKFSGERLIQLIVECASDINNHVVLELKQRPPEDYASSFIRAAEVGLISRELADLLKGSGGMRNIIVHEYIEIDDKKVFDVLPKAISGFKKYIKQVDRFLDKVEKRKNRK